MIKNTLALGIVLFISLASFSQYGQCKAAEDSKEKLVRMGEAYRVPDTEIKTLKDKALQGDPKAAFRLSLFYDICQRDYKEGNFWTMIAAENDHPTGEYNFGFALKDDPDPRNRLRARFWLKRAARHGVKEAVSLLKELEKEEAEK